MSAPLPIHLITGLLGSGKTTCLKQLIKQKPNTENWLILINEFGEVDIDTPQLQSQNHDNIQLKSIAGGCVCCSAQIGLVATLQQLLSTKNQFDRIFIEPTGLGHPAKIVDTLLKTTFPQALALQKIICLITPQQLTIERWKKSNVMRDLVTLADCILLNKTDLAEAENINEANQILQNLYPPKAEIQKTQFGQIDLKNILQSRPVQKFTVLSSSLVDIEFSTEHQQQLNQEQKAYYSKIPGILEAYSSQNRQGQTLSIGWIWEANTQFNRVKLKAIFNEIASYLLRAKGLLKTGNEWQLLNWSENQFDLSDIAWRNDSRLEILFLQDIDIPVDFIVDLENKLTNCIHNIK